MITALFRGAGRIALLLATMAFLAVVSLFVIGSFILTWPVHRSSPRERKLKASMDFAQAGMALLTAFSEGSMRKMLAESLDPPSDDEDPALEALRNYGRHSPNCAIFTDHTDDCTCGWDGTVTQFGLNRGESSEG